MRWASIDIGTNTLRLLIADIDSGRLNPVFLKRIITRLGGDYKEDVGIERSAQKRTVDALRVFSEKIKEYDAKKVMAVATSVVRRARNREEFIKDVLKQAGIAVNVVSGDEEARLSMLGVMSVVGNDQRQRLMIDIGGGSTEFAAVHAGIITGIWSLEMGVVHLTEEFLRKDPPAQDELRAMEHRIEAAISELRGSMGKNAMVTQGRSAKSGSALVGTAGTITTLAAIDQGLEYYEPDRINNYTLGYQSVKEIYRHIASLPLKEREKIFSLEKGREDLIIPGAAIVLKVMEGFGFDSMTVSDAGLLEGIILNELKGSDIQTP